MKCYIAGSHFEHQVQCTCPCGSHSERIKINRGDTLVITCKRRYSRDEGWFALVGLNNAKFFYLAYSELEQYILNQLLFSLVDIELKLNYFSYKINQALDMGHQLEFYSFSNYYLEYSELKDMLNMQIDEVTV